MAGRKSDFTLPTLDDLFSTQEIRDEAKLAKIRDIPIDLIDDFPDHPYKVRDDEDMMQLVESIKERGVITPATVRQKEDGRYELISGHRRKRASELAGFETLRCEVVELDRDDAIIGCHIVFVVGGVTIQCIGDLIGAVGKVGISDREHISVALVNVTDERAKEYSLYGTGILSHLTDGRNHFIH